MVPALGQSPKGLVVLVFNGGTDMEKSAGSIIADLIEKNLDPNQYFIIKRNLISASLERKIRNFEKLSNTEIQELKASKIDCVMVGEVLKNQHSSLYSAVYCVLNISTNYREKQGFVKGAKDIDDLVQQIVKNVTGPKTEVVTSVEEKTKVKLEEIKKLEQINQEAMRQRVNERRSMMEKKKQEVIHHKAIPRPEPQPLAPSPIHTAPPSTPTKLLKPSAPLANAETVPSTTVTKDIKIVTPKPTSTEEDFNTESYDRIYENPFLDVVQNPLSTFSIDVDTASYSNVRRFFNQNSIPPKDAVRIEEMVNYFKYDYPQPKNNDPFSINVDVADCPWKAEHRLVSIGLKGKELSQNERPNCNLIFLIDVSGSMNSYNKLPLLKQAFKMLVQNLTEKDSVGIVVYAGASGVVLPPTKGDKKEIILQALDKLSAGGSTNAGKGIELAYKLAVENFQPKGANRVILATDGDFNVGITSRGDFLRMIEEKAKSKVFLTVLGFGMGNYKDSMLEMLADKGNGNYGYIDDIAEAKKMLVEQLTGTLITIAKDVKIQVEFNPIHIAQYRLIGYENRILQSEDFNDDTKDAGEIGSGHTVTAFYELVPTGVKKVEVGKVDNLKYQVQPQLSEVAKSNEIMTVKLRYKQPDQNDSKLLEFPVTDENKQIQQSSKDFMFASSVVCFGMILRDSQYKGSMTLDFVLELAEEGTIQNSDEYRKEFIELVKKAKKLTQK